MEQNLKKWRLIVPNTMDTVTRRAAYDLYGIVNAYLPYPLSIEAEQTLTEQTKQDHLLILGTTQNSTLLAAFAEQGIFTPQTQKEGYTVHVAASPMEDASTVCILCGADSAGTLYAVHAFARDYLRGTLKFHGYHYNHRFAPFTEAMPDWDASSYPKIDARGIWTWGHKIYDYRKFLSHMSACGMNLLVMWNDFVPVNAEEILAEAHSRNIRIYWGFSCSWGETVNPADPLDVKKWCRRVVNVYQTEYAPLGGDGVYFQAFTETSAKDIDGIPIAKLVSNWANAICGALHAFTPDLSIAFGIHATSIGDAWQTLSDIDPNVAVMWEDCGAFPYAYDPAITAGAADALEYTRNLLTLCGEKTRFAAVLKGHCVLNWQEFSHYHGPVVIGEMPQQFLKERTEDRSFTWQYSRAYWLSNAKRLQAYMQLVAEAPIRETMITALIEDGLFETTLDPSVLLYAELLWDWDRDIDALTAAVQLES